MKFKRLSISGATEYSIYRAMFCGIIINFSGSRTIAAYIESVRTGGELLWSQQYDKKEYSLEEVKGLVILKIEELDKKDFPLTFNNK